MVQVFRRRRVQLQAGHAAAQLPQQARRQVNCLSETQPQGGYALASSLGGSLPQQPAQAPTARVRTNGLRAPARRAASTCRWPPP